MGLGAFLEERLFTPLQMADSASSIPQSKAARVAQPLLPYEVITIYDPTVPAANDLGGEGGLSTAADYLRFGQMLLDGGRLGKERILSRSTVALMTSDPARRVNSCGAALRALSSGSTRKRSWWRCSCRRGRSPLASGIAG